MSDSTPPTLAVAVVGVSALFPGSSDAQGFWRDILAGKEGLAALTGAMLADLPPADRRAVRAKIQRAHALSR